MDSFYEKNMHIYYGYNITFELGPFHGWILHFFQDSLTTVIRKTTATADTVVTSSFHTS